MELHRSATLDQCTYHAGGIPRCVVLHRYEVYEVAHNVGGSDEQKLTGDPNCAKRIASSDIVVEALTSMLLCHSERVIRLATCKCATLSRVSYISPLGRRAVSMWEASCNAEKIWHAGGDFEPIIIVTLPACRVPHLSAHRVWLYSL